MKGYSVFGAALLCAAGALAGEDEIERLDFVMSTGTQYADTGYVPHSRKTRAIVAGKGTVSPHLSGLGLMTVKRYGGKKGFVFSIR